MDNEVFIINNLILDGYSDKESIFLAKIIHSQRRIYKWKSIRACIRDEENELYRKTIKKKIKSEGWYKYQKEARRLTEINAHLVDGIENRGFKKMHLDHKVSIWYGWVNKIEPSIIASVNNLQMLPYKENMRKGVKVSNEDLNCLDLKPRQKQY